MEIAAFLISLVALGLSIASFLHSKKTANRSEEAAARELASYLSIGYVHGTLLEIKNNHPSMTFTDISVGIETKKPPYSAIEHFSFLAPGVDELVPVEQESKIGVTFRDPHGSRWPRRFVGYAYILDRID